MIMTPEEYPDHSVIGRYFKANGCIYYCDSYDTTCGYWMTPVFGDEHAFTSKQPYRTNVSEKAIDRTYHTIWDCGSPDVPFYQSRHILTKEERDFINERMNNV